MIMLLLLKKLAWLVRSTTKAALQLKTGRNFDVRWLCVGLDPGEPEPCAGCQVLRNAFVPERCRALPRAPERCSASSERQWQCSGGSPPPTRHSAKAERLMAQAFTPDWARSLSRLATADSLRLGSGFPWTDADSLSQKVAMLVDMRSWSSHLSTQALLL